MMLCLQNNTSGGEAGTGSPREDSGYNAGVKPLHYSRVLPWLVLAASLLIAFGTWHWATAIFLPSNAVAARASQRPIGNNSDLYPRWLGARAALIYGRSPYSDDVTREIQTGFYGRPLDPRKPGDPAAQEAFVYPLYVIFLLAPTITLPFRTAQEIFRWLLLVGLGCSVPLWMHAIGFRPRRVWVLSGVVLALSTYPAVLEFYMQNLATLVIFLLAAAAALLVRNWQALSGMVLALSTIKPEISWLVILWLLLWAISDYAKRKRLIWSFLGTMLLQVLAAEVVVPGWVGQFFAAVRGYPAYGSDPNIFAVFLPRWLAKIVTAALIGVLLAMLWRWRKAAAGTAEFGWALGWAAAVTLAILPKLAAYNQPLLIPVLLVLIDHYEAISRSSVLPRALTKGAFACQIWQWTAALTLSLCSLIIPTARLLPAAQWPVLTFLALPPMTLLAVAATSSVQKPIPRILAAPRG